MMIDTQTPIGILAVHFGSHDIAAVGDSVQKSSYCKFTQIGNDKRPCVDRTDDSQIVNSEARPNGVRGDRSASCAP